MVIEKVHSVLRYIQGFRTSKKLVVFESDDWGSIRMPDKAARDTLIKHIPEIKNDPYNLYDTLESSYDLNFLFETLQKFKDKNGNHPVITTNTSVANPDFKAIKENDFNNFVYERFDKTIANYYGSVVNELWKSGIENKFIYPQLHGREHVHALSWLKELRSGNGNLRTAFDNKCFGIPYKIEQSYQRTNLSAALNFMGLNEEEEFQEKYLRDAVKIFEEYFGFKSNSFIAPAYIWSEKHEEILSQLGVKSFQGIGYQYIPITSSSFSRKFHYTSQKNKFGQYYLVRNAFFEPSLLPNKDWVDDCLSRINLAFKFNKPAIVGTHRVNFIGSIEENNRDKNLKFFKKLLEMILKRWPDVEFTTSDKFFNILNNNSIR